MFKDVDLITGSLFPLFFAFFENNTSTVLKLILTLAGTIAGYMLLIIQYNTTPIQENERHKSANRTYTILSLLLRLYTTESIIFYKIYYMNIDTALPITVSPFLLLLTFEIPQYIRIEKYQTVSNYVIIALCVIFLIFFIVLPYSTFSDPLIYMSTWALFTSCMWFVVETGYLSFVYIFFFLASYLTNPKLSKMLWQNDSVPINILQLVLFVYSCIIYSIRIRELVSDSIACRVNVKMFFVMHVLIIGLAINFAKNVCDVSGVYTAILIVYKIYALF